MKKLNQKQIKELQENVGILICQIGKEEAQKRLNTFKMTEKDFSTLTTDIDISKIENITLLESAKNIINEESFIPHHLEYIEKK